LDESGPQVVALLSAATAFFFSLTESALLNYSPPRFLELARKRSGNSGFVVFIDTDQRILLLCRTLATLSIVAFVLAVYFWVRGDREPTVPIILQAGAIAAGGLLTVVRMVPVTLGRLFPEEILLALRPVLVGLHAAFRPLAWLALGTRRVTERLSGRKLEEGGHQRLEEEIMSAVEEGEMEGLIEQSEAEMIERALAMHEADAADVMTPRTRMFAFPVDGPLAEAVAKVSQEGHSRVPLYAENIDEIVGILYAKDVLAHWSSPEREKLTLREIARAPLFIPETKRIRQLLEEFKREKTHMAIVVDEYGGTAGLVTIEDILEEIVGEIEDEFDDETETPTLERTGEDVVEADAMVHVDELAEVLDTELDSTEFDTVGGLVFSALGRIPKAGDEFSHAGLHFTVLDADERSVNRVRVARDST
jgi:CBS domain containing-hemolysin-like protein